MAKKIGLGDKVDMTAAPPHDMERVGKRLERIRVACGLGTQEDMGERLGVSKGRINNWFKGVALIPVSHAVKLKEITGLPLDYIYCGDISSVPVRLADELGREPSE